MALAYNTSRGKILRQHVADVRLQTELIVRLSLRLHSFLSIIR